MPRRRPLHGALALLLACTSVASAGTVILGTRAPKDGTTEIRVQDGRVRMTTTPGQALYYDHAAKTAYFVDTAKGTYVAMDEARARKAAAALPAQQGDFQRRMQEQLAKLPPEKRAMVEGMMPQQMTGAALGIAGAPPAPPKLAKAGAGTVGAWSCERYAGAAGGTAVEVCAAPPASVGVPAGDFAALEGLRALTRAMAEQARVAGGTGIGPDDGYVGLPLERVERRGNALVERFTVTAIRQEAIPPADVTPPAGLRPVQLPGAPNAP